MKHFIGFAAIAAVALLLTGCGAKEDTETTDNAPTTSSSSPGTTTVSLDNDICAKCGCCAGCDDCCKGEKCDCGFQKGSTLCCVEGMESKDGAYCKGCGYLKGDAKCCSEDNDACGKCGLAKGSPLCCKLPAKDEG